MSKTVEELARIYGDAYWARPEFNADESRQAGVRAVVSALRDEFSVMPFMAATQRKFDEILGSDAGEKVADK